MKRDRDEILERLLRDLAAALLTAADRLAALPPSKVEAPPMPLVRSMPAEQKQTHPVWRVSGLVKATGISRSTIYKAAKEGKLKLRKNGSSTMIMAADVEAWLASMSSFKR